LFFLHVPFEDQTGIPDFDTARLTDSYSNFFETNRFSGADRIGDTQQVTIGLSSRILARDNGREIMNARLAQIHYFDDRRVSLDGITESQPKSNLIAELDLSPITRLRIGSKLVYDEQNKKLLEKNLSINYAGNGYAANAEYYFTDQTLEQAALSLVYPVNDRWTIIAKYHQSLLFDKPVENLFGLNYESCCWGLKILASQTSDDDFLVTDRAVYFELTFKGLSQAGRDIDAQLAKAIPGYLPGF
jgi:LPS-assembly protein